MSADAPELDRRALERACHDMADQILRYHLDRPDVSRVEVLADRFSTIAAAYAEDFTRPGTRPVADPNFVTRAIRYLAHHHAIPPMGEDASWLRLALELLIELGRPNTPGAIDLARFYDELEEGQLRADAADS